MKKSGYKTIEIPGETYTTLSKLAALAGVRSVTAYLVLFAEKKDEALPLDIKSAFSAKEAVRTYKAYAKNDMVFSSIYMDVAENMKDRHIEATPEQCKAAIERYLKSKSQPCLTT